MTARARLTVAAAVILLAAAPRVAAQGPGLVRPEDAIVALFGLNTDIDVERKMLQREESQYDGNVRRRADLRERLTRAYAELEDLFLQESGEPPAGSGAREADRDRPSEAELRQAADAKEIEIRTLESTEIAAREEARALRAEIRRIRARIGILARQAEALKATLPRDRDSVTGIWDVVLMPSGDRGVFALWQTGTIVAGQYVLDGPFRGSLEGTLVNRQIVLKRIDARLGRSMELSGYVSEDGQTVQGTWLNYDLSSGRSPTGQWSARKRSSAPSEGPGATGGESEP